MTKQKPISPTTMYAYECGKKDMKEDIVKMIKGLKCEVPKNSLPTTLNDLETFTVERIDDCLKYAGRFNYNKALSDLLAEINKK